MTSSNGYFVVEQGQRQGPFDLAVLQTKVREGTLSETTLLWTDGMADWQPARTVLPEIFSNTAGGSAMITQDRLDPIASPDPQPLMIARPRWRVLAAIIDFCLVLFVMNVVLVPAGIATFFAGFLGELFYPVVAGVYSALMISSKWQATIGKKILGLKVVDQSGARPSVSQSWNRGMGSVVSWAIFGIGNLFFFFTPRRQNLHDMMAGTLVVKTGSR